MATELETFINNVVIAAKAKDSEAMKRLITSGPNINQLDNKGMNAARYLGQVNNLEACMFLMSFGANVNDCVWGLFCGNHIDSIAVLMQQPIRRVIDYGYAAAGAAYGNHVQLLVRLLNSLSPEKRDFARFASAAARNGHRALAEELMKYNRTNLNLYFILALSAVTGGHLGDLIYYLSKVKHDQIDYFQLACTAAASNEEKILSYLLEKIDPRKINYHLLAEYATMGGHLELTEKLLEKVEESNHNYQRLAECAVKDGHRQLAQHFLSKMQPEQRNLNAVAAKALQYGHESICDYFLNNLPANQRNYQMLAQLANHVGLYALSLKYTVLSQQPMLRPEYHDRISLPISHKRKHEELMESDENEIALMPKKKRQRKNPLETATVAGKNPIVHNFQRRSKMKALKNISRFTHSRADEDSETMDVEEKTHAQMPNAFIAIVVENENAYLGDAMDVEATNISASKFGA
jgi:hypothetical protein